MINHLIFTEIKSVKRIARTIIQMKLNSVFFGSMLDTPSLLLSFPKMIIVNSEPPVNVKRIQGLIEFWIVTYVRNITAM